MAEVLTVGLSALVDLVSGFLGAMGKSFIERRSRIDEGLRAKRAEVYSELWTLTGILPQYPKDEKLTYGKLAAQSEALREWYFQKSGGIYLSRESQKIYLAFQKTINDLVEGQKENLDGQVSPTDYDRARAAGSTLRSSLTDDLHSRSESRSF
jgi:hypothetical protein